MTPSHVCETTKQDVLLKFQVQSTDVSTELLCADIEPAIHLEVLSSACEKIHKRPKGAYLTRVVHLSDVTLRFEIWDTAGQEKYHSVTPLYYRGAHTALLIYDISKKETFIRAQMWLKELEKQYIPGSTVIWLVGNKGDLTQDRQVSVQEGQALASDRGLSFTETSALSGDQVSELLLAIAHRVYECVGAQQGGLSEWQETPHMDLRHRDTFNPFGSCCKVGP